jgi:ABC-type uncharacterized transport system permease subunit
VVVLVALVAAVLASPLKDRLRPGALLASAGLCLAAGWCWIAQPTWILPSQIWLALPYVLTLVALASLQNTDDSPLELGVPYSRDGGR